MSTTTTEVSAATEATNLIKGLGSLALGAATGCLTATTTVVDAAVNDGLPLVNSCISQAIPVTKELCKLPLTTAVGIKMESGKDREIAEQEAYRVINQPVSDSIRQAAEKSGAITEKLWSSFNSAPKEVNEA